MRISDWSSDVCSSDLAIEMALQRPLDQGVHHSRARALELSKLAHDIAGDRDLHLRPHLGRQLGNSALMSGIGVGVEEADGRSEEHTSELQSLMRSSYAVYCSKHHSRAPYPLTH